MSDGLPAVCGAPDCEEAPKWPREYCSTVCMNVAVKVAAETLGAAIESGSASDIDRPTTSRVAEIRDRQEKTHQRIAEKLEADE